MRPMVPTKEAYYRQRVPGPKIGKLYSRFDSDDIVQHEVEYRLENWDEFFADRYLGGLDEEGEELDEDRKEEIAREDVYEDWDFIWQHEWEYFCDDIDNLVEEIEAELKKRNRPLYWFWWTDNDDVQELKEEGSRYTPDAKKLFSFDRAAGLFRHYREGPERIEVHRYGKYGFTIEFFRERYYFRPEHLFLRDHAKPRKQKPMELPADTLTKLLNGLLEVA